jgi:hypothetical protein
MAAKIEGRTFTLESNPLGFESVTFDFSDSVSTVKIKKGNIEESITCGYGTWQSGETTLFNEPWMREAAPIVASGAWTNEDSLATVIRFYETPFYQTAVYRFVGDQLTLQTRINVGFQPPETVMLVGHAV